MCRAMSISAALHVFAVGNNNRNNINNNNNNNNNKRVCARVCQASNN